MKEDAPEQKVKQYCAEVRKEISHWKDNNQNGCNLTRNHIIYYQRLIREICTENQLPFPEEYYFSPPPEVDKNYMANLKQKERVKRIFSQRKIPAKQKYVYDEQQMSLF